MQGRHRTSLVALMLVIATAAGVAVRKPLPRPILGKIEHQPTGTRLRLDPKTGEPVEYAVDGKITLDREAGRYLLSWNGIDGRRKTVVYEPRSKVDAVVAAWVSLNCGERTYRYAYCLRSLPSSAQKLQTLFVEARAEMAEVEAPDAAWYSRPLTDYLCTQLQVEGGWVWSQTKQGRVGLAPGEEVCGFSFASSGLPVLVKSYVSGRAYIVGVGEELPEELHAAIDRVAWRIPTGLTVGPGTVPQPFVAGPFVQKLVDYISVSLDNGWIESAQVALALKGSMAQIRQALAKGDKARAVTRIDELLSTVEHERDNTLLSEAYALLRYNLEYLRAHLKAR